MSVLPWALEVLKLKVLLCAATLAAVSLVGNAEPRSCMVVGVSDGDTITARCGATGNYEQVKVRIAAIDAPEKAQPFGQRSRQSLAELCHLQQATIYQRDIDRYGRTVADVECRKQDVARHQVARGMAWVYERYAKIVDAPLYKVQDVAQDGRIGLWRDAEPVAPWEWRKATRSQ